MTKQQTWDQTAAKINQIVDGLGKRIDPGIKEAVVALNVSGINTSGSCEGHLDWGTVYPWVDIESAEAVHLLSDLDQLSQQVGEKFYEDPAWIELSEKIKQLNLLERKKLMRHLEEFYDARIGPYRQNLIISPLGLNRSRLESQQGDLIKLENKAEQQKWLKAHKKEMQDFTDFLKQKFFSG